MLTLFFLLLTWPDTDDDDAICWNNSGSDTEDTRAQPNSKPAKKPCVGDSTKHKTKRKRKAAKARAVKLKDLSHEFDQNSDTDSDCDDIISTQESDEEKPESAQHAARSLPGLSSSSSKRASPVLQIEVGCLEMSCALKDTAAKVRGRLTSQLPLAFRDSGSRLWSSVRKTTTRNLS